MDRELAGQTEAQHSAFTRAQVLALGFTPGAVRHRVRTGRWEALGHEIYRLPGSRPTWEQQLMVAVLAAGRGAAASHRSAAALLRLSGFKRSGIPEVTTPRSRRHRATGARIHQSTDLAMAHVTTVDGIVTTTTTRTLFDLAGVLPPGAVRAGPRQLPVRPGGDYPRPRRTARPDRPPRPPSSAVLRRLLDERSGDGYVAPASELEARFLALVRSARLPEPVRQFSAGDAASWVGRVDFAYPELKLLIELDGRRYHSAKVELEADRMRDNRLTAAGWRVLRITWMQLIR